MKKLDLIIGIIGLIAMVSGFISGSIIIYRILS